MTDPAPQTRRDAHLVPSHPPSTALCKMLQDAVQAFAVAAPERHAAMVPEIAQGDKAALPTHACEVCTAERLSLPPGGMGAMRVRGLPMLPQGGSELVCFVSRFCCSEGIFTHVGADLSLRRCSL